MARIGKAEQSRILHLVDVEQRKVADIAAEYGCTPANIYATLSRLRRAGGAEPADGTGIGKAAAPPASDQDRSELAPMPPAEPAGAPDLFAAAALPMPEPISLPAAQLANPAATGQARIAEATWDAGSAAARPAEQPREAAPHDTRLAETIEDRPRRGGAVAKGGGVGASLAKPGFGLVMRTEEGDDALTPFRSLDDLLSAIKPILRAAARSPDTVWFAIQPIDLAALDSDAA